MTYISWRGIDVSARVQNVLLAVQYLALLLFVVVALFKVYGGSAPEGYETPALSWFNPFGFDSLSGFTEAILLAIFIYWGWDTCSPSTRRRQTASGRRDELRSCRR